MQRHAGESVELRSNMIHIRKIKLRVQPLGIHIKRNCYNIKISSTLTVSKKTAFYTFCSGKKSHFALGNSFSAVVMMMKRNNAAVASRKITAEIFNLICKLIWKTAFYGCRKIQNHLVLRCSTPGFHNSTTDFHCIICFCLCKIFR